MKNFASLVTMTLVITLCVVLGACTAAEKSAGNVLDNAGSVVRHGGDKLFVEPEATPIPEQRY
jgi:hypothetical protein